MIVAVDDHEINCGMRNIRMASIALEHVNRMPFYRMATPILLDGTPRKVMLHISNYTSHIAGNFLPQGSL